MEEILIGTTDRTILIWIADPASTTGAGKTGLNAAALTCTYTRVETDNDVIHTDVTSSLNDLSALTDAHNDWGLKEVSSTLSKGLYRLDIADAVFATGAWYAVVQVTITSGTAAATPKIFKLVNLDMFGTPATNLATAGTNYSATRGLSGTALPAAAADAAGGLPISDAGGLDLDAKIGALTFTVANKVDANITHLSGDSVAADNAEAFFDGTGYAGTNNVIPTVTTLTNLPAIPANWLTAAGTAADFGAELATAIWTDTTAGDFTVAASIGKSIMNGVALGTGLTINAYTGNTPQTGDSFARIGAAGAGLTAVPWNAAWDAEVQSEVDDGLKALFLDKLVTVSGTADSGSMTTMVDAARTEADNDYWKGQRIVFTSGNIIGQSAIITDFVAATDTFTFAPALTQAVGTQTYVILPSVSVWEDVLAEHLTAGSTGNALNAAGSAGDPWATALPGLYGAGTAGRLVGRSLPDILAGGAGGLMIAGSNAATTFAGLTVTGALTATNAGNDITLGATTLGAIADAVLDEDMTAHQTFGTLGGTIGDPGGSSNTIWGLTSSIYSAAVAITGSVNDAAASTTAFNTNLTQVDDYWNDALLTFTSGALSGQTAPILDFANVNGRITLSEAVTSAPANGVTFSIIPSHVHPVTQIATGVWASATRTLTAGTNIVLAKGVGITGFNDIAATDIVSAGAITTSAGKVSGVILVDTITTYTGNTKQTGDAFARLGAPAGVSVSADVAAVKVDTAAVKLQTDQFVFTVANQVDANIQYVNDVQITGNGQAGTEWGP